MRNNFIILCISVIAVISMVLLSLFTGCDIEGLPLGKSLTEGPTPESTVQATEVPPPEPTEVPTMPPTPRPTQTIELKYTSGSHYWTPVNVVNNRISITMIGGGGGGGGAFLGSGRGGGGDAGYINNRTYTVNPNLTYVITVGGGGAGGQFGCATSGCSQQPTAGGNGGNTYLRISGGDTVLVAAGGSEGPRSSTSKDCEGVKSGDPEDYGDGGDGGGCIVPSGGSGQPGHSGKVIITYTAYTE